MDTSKLNSLSEYEIQAIDFAKKYNVTLVLIGDPVYKVYFETDSNPRWVFTCCLKRNEEEYQFTFGQSIAAGKTSPSMYDILTCLQKYDPGTFEDFCKEFGYSEDSRRAERTYKAVLEEWEAVEHLFGDCLEELHEIQ